MCAAGGRFLCAKWAHVAHPGGPAHELLRRAAPETEQQRKLIRYRNGRRDDFLKREKCSRSVLRGAHVYRVDLAMPLTITGDSGCIRGPASKATEPRASTGLHQGPAGPWPGPHRRAVACVHPAGVRRVARRRGARGGNRRALHRRGAGDGGPRASGRSRDSSEEIRQAAHAFKGAVGNLTRDWAEMATVRAARGDRARGCPGRDDAGALMRLLDEQVAGLLDELKAGFGFQRRSTASSNRRRLRVMRHALGRKLSSWDSKRFPGSAARSAPGPGRAPSPDRAD